MCLAPLLIGCKRLCIYLKPFSWKVPHHCRISSPLSLASGEVWMQRSPLTGVIRHRSSSALKLKFLDHRVLAFPWVWKQASLCSRGDLCAWLCFIEFAQNLQGRAKVGARKLCVFSLYCAEAMVLGAFSITVLPRALCTSRSCRATARRWLEAELEDLKSCLPFKSASALRAYPKHCSYDL